MAAQEAEPAALHAAYQMAFNADGDDSPLWSDAPHLNVVTKTLQAVQTLTADIDRTRVPTFEQLIRLAFASVLTRTNSCNLQKLINSHADRRAAATYMLSTWVFLHSALSRLQRNPVQVEHKQEGLLLGHFQKACEFVLEHYQQPQPNWTWHPLLAEDDAEMRRIRESMGQTSLLLCTNLPAAGLCHVYGHDDDDGCRAVRFVALSRDAVEEGLLTDPEHHTFQSHGLMLPVYCLLMHECVHLLWRVRNRRESPDRQFSEALANDSGYVFEAEVMRRSSPFDPLGFQRLDEDKRR
mmetsp:Transcript_177/g.592  ORF Transcript_177/g.592 Transcript_177/m.592 type:complete len:295 (+) Transcript_177:164-1048(+)